LDASDANNPIAPGVFRLVEGLVGGAQQIVLAAHAVRQQGNADTDGNAQLLLAMQQHQRFDSSRPLGPSAVHELVEVLHGLLGESWGEHPIFGKGNLNCGLIEGGLASNVVAPSATATLMARLVEAPGEVEARIRRHLGQQCEFEAEKAYGPVEFLVPFGDADAAPVVAFGTDAPWLGKWGQPVLYGPGSIDDAHTDHEKLELDSFERAVAEYERTVRSLLAGA
jgi:acetylornithine deacetylase